ncbi:MAG: homoserine O-acetyltransferase, partial [Cyclobacteriaceae bacterium]|nr:homoserine O-acetyltransferase [Cyclobacteriaceae bacterium]
MQTIELKPETKTITIEEAIILEGGHVLPRVDICYTTIGKPNKDKSNVVWVFHALTGNSNPLDWWPWIMGSEAAFDPEEHFVVCANVLGSCYGTTGPV